MKHLHLVFANLRRRLGRNILTVLSVAMALFLFASLRAVVTTIEASAQFGGANRLVTLNATGLVFPMPLAYANRIEAIPGVKSVTWSNWFGGQYGDGKRFFGQFAVEPESYLAMYPEMVVSPEDKAAFMQEKTGALVGKALLDVFGWKVGQDVTLQGTIFPGDWTFKIVGTYQPSNNVISEEMMLFRHDYMEERLSNPGQAGWYVIAIDDPNQAATVSKTVDDLFENSTTPTKTGTEQAFNASFATMWGNVSGLMGTIGMAVVFAILLVTANTMMMSSRERTREVAVLKTIGFSNGTMFGLVMVEAAIITLGGALIGLAGAKILYRSIEFNAAGFLPGFDVTTGTLAIGTGVALALMLASGIVPAIRAARLPIVQALRNVE